MRNSILFWGVLGVVVFSMTACVQQFSYENVEMTAQPGAREPHTFLQKYLQFSDKDLAAMEQGDVVAKVFDTRQVENEVGAFGVVNLNVSKSLFIERFRDVETFMESHEVKAIRILSDPPRFEDTAGLTLDAQDLHALKSCRPGKCKVKIDDVMMNRFQQEVDWAAHDAHDQAAALMRQFLVEYASAYLKYGDAALGEYHDQAEPLRIADAFAELFDNSPYFEEYAPELYRYLQEFPHRHLDNVESFVYWSEEQFGLKPVINLFHVVIYTRNQTDSTDVFIISKQIYASHYFETSLSFTAFVDEVNGTSTGTSYLMYLNRSRFDNLRGKIKGFVISLAKGQVYDGVKKYFQQVKSRLENEYVAVSHQ